MAADSPPSAPEVNPWFVAIAVMFATFMQVLDTTVVNVSLPHIAGSLSASVNEATWALTSYLVSNAIILPITGWLANFFGRKRLLITAVSGFTAASFLCGLAPSLPVLILFRIIQGAAGGALAPVSQAILLEAFPSKDWGKAMAFWSLGILVAPMLGPVIGGWLTDSYSWRWVFYINVPIGLISLVMITLFIFDPPYIRRTSSRVDYWGLGLLAIGIGALQTVLDKGQEEDWFSSRWLTHLAILSAVTLVIFLIHELRTHEPVVNLRVLRIRTFGAGVFLTTVLGFVLYGNLVLLPIFLQTLLGYPALQAGIAMFPRGLGSFLAMPVIGILVSRLDARKLLVCGMAGAAVSLFQFSRLNLDAGYWDIFWPQFLQGVAFSLLFVPLTTATMDPILKEEMGNATSIFNLMRNIGGSVGIATVTTLVARHSQTYINVLGVHVNAYTPQTRAMLDQLRAISMAHGTDQFTATRQAYAALFDIVVRQATVLSFLQVFRLLGFIFLAVAPLVLLLKRPGGRVAAVSEQ